MLKVLVYQDHNMLQICDNTVQQTHCLIHWLSPFENLTKIEFSSDKERNSCLYINSLNVVYIKCSL